MSMPDPAPQVQRLEEDENPVQMSSLAQSITPVVQRAFQGGENQTSGDLESRLHGSKGGGSPLAPEVQAFMEPRFGSKFNNVRVHTGGEAVQMSKELGAQAFTHGSDVYFGEGKAPGNNELTAHELTHVVQQTGTNSVQRSINIQRKCSACEAEEAEVENATLSKNLLKPTEKLLQRQTTSNAGSGLQPPGGCTRREHEQLQQEVDNWCKGSRRCTRSQTPEQIQQNIQNNINCIAARNLINQKCFRGGDPNHRGELQSAINSLVNCQDIQQRQQAGQTQQQPLPSVSPSLKERLSQITGLTGAALTVYIIISVGSRFLFPPRNLVPVP